MSQTHPRWTGLLALVVTIATVVALSFLVVKADGWTGRHAGALSLAVVTLVLAAREWTARWFRVTVVLVLVLVLAVTAKAGRARLVEDDVASDRALATELLATVEQTTATFEVGQITAKGQARRALEALPTGTRRPLAAPVEAALSQPASATLGPARRAVTQASESAPIPIAALDRLAAALALLRDPVATGLVAADARAKVTRLCEARGGAFAPDPAAADPEAQSCHPTAGSGRGPALIQPTDRTEARKAVANLRAAAAMSAAAAGAAGEAVTAAEAAIQESRVRPFGLTQSVAAGARDLAEAVWGSTRPVVPGAVGWALLAIAALYLYRRLEILNAGQERGPVMVDDVAGDVDGKKEEYTGLLRYAVLKNLPEPGVVPGSEEITPLTDLIGTDPEGKVIATVIRLARLIGFPARGYIVRANILGPGKDETGHRVSVRALNARTRRTMWTGYAFDPDVRRALLLAGATASSWILAQSRVVPPWLQFSPLAAGALPELWRSETSVAADRRAALERAVRQDPTAGSVLVQLGYEFSLSGEHLRALDCYERATRMFPEYGLARYRAACSWSALAQTVAAADRQVLRLHVEGNPVAVDASVCLQMARRRLERLRGPDRWWPVQWGLPHLSRAERPAMPPARQWRSMRRTLDAALVCLEVRETPPGQPLAPTTGERLDRLVTMARDTRSWQLAYNAACATSLAFEYTGDPSWGEESLALLWTALVKPDSEELTRAWLEIDPDLARVRDGFPDAFSAMLLHG